MDPNPNDFRPAGLNVPPAPEAANEPPNPPDPQPTAETVEPVPSKPWVDDLQTVAPPDADLNADLDRTIKLAREKGLTWVVFILADLPSALVVVRKFMNKQMSAFGHALLFLGRILISVFTRKR